MVAPFVVLKSMLGNVLTNFYEVRYNYIADNDTLLIIYQKKKVPIDLYTK